MVKKEEYELLPHEEIKRLRKEISALKTRDGLSKIINFQDDLKELKHAIKKLVNVFENASDSIKEDKIDSKAKSQGQKSIEGELEALKSSMQKINDENALIAQVIIKLNDNITDLQAMFSELDKKIKVILNRTYIKVPGDYHSPKHSSAARVKRTDILQKYQNEFSQ